MTRALAGALLVALATTTCRVSATPADVDALGELLRPVSTLHARFTQTVLGAHFEVLQRGEGTLEIERPGRFRWQTDDPYPQLIVTNGERVYVYDEDLAQVQIRPIAEAFDGTPARVLAGEIDALADEFDVSRIEEPSAARGSAREEPSAARGSAREEPSAARGSAREEPSAAFRLTPRADGAPYRELKLSFHGKEIRQIEVVDSLGQLTQVELFDVRINRPIDASRFVFEIPSGVDVIGDRPAAP